MVRWNRMKFGDNNSNTLGECMLKFVQNGACLHFWVQKVWGAHFFWTHCICTGEQVLWSWCVRVFVRGVSRNALYKCTILTYLLTYLLTCLQDNSRTDWCLSTKPGRLEQGMTRYYIWHAAHRFVSLLRHSLIEACVRVSNQMIQPKMPGVRDPISKFWDPLNILQMEKATIFKFGTHIGSCCPRTTNWPTVSRGGGRGVQSMLSMMQDASWVK